MRHVSKIRCLLFAGLLIAGGCDNGETPTDPSPAPTVTETFTGVLTQNGALTHPFVTSAQGTVTATLKALEPAATIGFSMGTWNGTTCTAVVADDAATTAAVLEGSVIGPNSLCIRIYDPRGNVAGEQPVSYTVEVVHP